MGSTCNGSRGGRVGRGDQPQISRAPGLLPTPGLCVPYLHHSVADGPVGLLPAQEQQGEDDEGAPAGSHDQQTGHGLSGHACASWGLQWEERTPGPSLRLTRALCGFGSHSLATDLLTSPTKYPEYSSSYQLIPLNLR